MIRANFYRRDLLVRDGASLADFGVRDLVVGLPLVAAGVTVDAAAAAAVGTPAPVARRSLSSGRDEKSNRNSDTACDCGASFVAASVGPGRSLFLFSSLSRQAFRSIASLCGQSSRIQFCDR